MSNDEVRMTKEIRMTKLEGGFGTPSDISSFFRHSNFDILHLRPSPFLKLLLHPRDDARSVLVVHLPQHFVR